MDLLKWNNNKQIRLFINKKEMDFNTEITFSDHTSNFSSITFNNVIPKDKNNVNEIFKIHDYGTEFSIGEVYIGSELVFFGIVYATGRLVFEKYQPKTKSIQIVDFRKWLSLKKPVNTVFSKIEPALLVTKLVEKLNEPRIIVGRLSFSDDSIINSYSTVDKTPYQVLKEVIAKETDSLLYFEITPDNKISINYKSNNDLLLEEKILVDLTNNDFFEKYKVTKTELETNIDNYANIIKYESENIISNITTVEDLIIGNSESITLLNDIGTILKTQETYLYKNTEKIIPVIINEKQYVTGMYYDILYTTAKNSVKVNKKYVNNNYALHLSYKAKTKNSIQLINWEERVKVAELSNTAGDVFKYEKTNDISDLNDLLRLCQGDLNISSLITKKFFIESEIPIWNVGQTAFIKTNNPTIDGVYLVISANGYILANTDNNNNNYTLPRFTYELINSKNANTLVNQFDNQSYKTNAFIDDFVLIETTDTIDDNVILHCKTNVKTCTTTDFITIDN